MIKTREDWEHVKTVAELQSGPSLQHAVDTIEALREAAREAKVILKESPPVTSHKDGKWWRGVPELRFNQMGRKVHALPDWIAEDDR